MTENGIEIPMEKEEKCGDFYLDGDYLSFSVIKDNKPINKKVIAEVYPESESKIEENPCRRKMQILINSIDRKLALKEMHSKIFNKLPKNTCYWSGIFMVCKKND